MMRRLAFWAGVAVAGGYMYYWYQSLKSALARALRVLASTIIKVTGPALGQIRVHSVQFRLEAEIALAYLFQAPLAVSNRPTQPRFAFSLTACTLTSHFSPTPRRRLWFRSHSSSELRFAQKRCRRVATAIRAKEMTSPGADGKDSAW